MLSIDISHAASFLSLPYEAALRPRLERAAGWLQNGGGKGSDFIGWVTLPRDYDRGEYARIMPRRRRFRAIPRRSSSSASAAAISARAASSNASAPRTIT